MKCECSSCASKVFLQKRIERLEKALRAIINAPGGGPAKRIATQALDE
jgi:hypothetical protein